MKLKKLCGAALMRLYRLLPVREVPVAALFDTPTMTRTHHALVALRYLFAEGYLQGNDTFIRIYCKAHHLGEYDPKGEDVRQFIALIESMRANGFSGSSALLMDLDGNVFDGTHRLAVCACLGIDTARVRQVPRHLHPEPISVLLQGYGLCAEEEAALARAYERLYQAVHGQA